MKALVLANDGISAAGKNQLEAAGFEVRTETVPQEELIDYINKENVAVLLVRSATKVRKDLMDACPGLKLVGRGGVGMDNIDVAYGRENGIDVFNTPGASSQAVAELAMAHIFSLARGLYDANRKMPIEGDSNFKVLKKKYAKGFELRGKKIAIVGFGRIGQALAQYALGVGMEVIGGGRSAKTVEVPVTLNGQVINVPVPVKPIEEAIAEADVISLHVPAQPDGGAVIGEKELASMKEGAVLVNLARGGVVDEVALKAAIESGHIKGAGIDVFVNEPNPSKEVLSIANASLTPHIGAATGEAQERIGIELADHIIASFK